MDEKKDSPEQDQIATEKEKKRGCCGPPLKIDWEAVRVDLTVPGVLMSQVADKWGIKRTTLRTRATRYGWRVPQNHIARCVATVARSVAQPVIEQAKEEAQQFVRETLELVRSGREKLAKHGNKPLNLSKLAVFADALDKLDKVGRRSLGLDAQQGNYNVGLAVSVNVNSENDAGNGAQTGPDSTEKAQSIDV